MTALGGDSVLQYPTHTELLESSCLPTSSAGTSLDAIIVPAARPAENLKTTIELAKETDARLVVLCSFRTHANEVRALLREHRLREPAVVEMPQEWDSWILGNLETTRWVHDGPGKGVCRTRNSDLSMKRNTGLLLARMLGWERVFFMDDDIRAVPADTVLATVALLGASGHGYRTAGLSVQKYPDNSVVCHARREVGEYQDVFVSGSALAVDCRVPFDFFPDLYNEDWLFFHRDAAEERLATPGSLAEQLPYDPFADPQRAASQEFGDVIAEGLYALLHKGLGPEAADEDYWEQFLESRTAVLHDVIRRLPAARPELREKISKAIGAAQQVLWAITAGMCAEYLAAWQRDLGRWDKRLANLPGASSLDGALETMGLRLGVAWALPEQAVGHPAVKPVVLPGPVHGQSDGHVHLGVEVKTVLDLGPGAGVRLRRPDEPDVLVQPHRGLVGGVYPEHELLDVLVAPVLGSQQVLDEPLAEPSPAQLGGHPYRLDIPGRGRIFPVLVGIGVLTGRDADNPPVTLRHCPFGRFDLVCPVFGRLRIDFLGRSEKGIR